MKALTKRKFRNNGFRSISESMLHPDVLKTFEKWKQNYNGHENCIIVGGLSVDMYIQRRPTEDIDILFLSNNDIPDRIIGFKRMLSKHMFEDTQTGVVVEFVTPERVNGNYKTFKEVFDAAIESEGIKIASPISIIALKLSRYSESDRADIIGLIEYCIENEILFDFSRYDLSERELENFKKLYNEKSDKIDENSWILETNQYFRQNIQYKKFDIGDCELYIFKDEINPIFHYGRNIQKQVIENIERKYKDFQFGFYLNDLQICYSSTHYNSMFNFEDEERMLKNWLRENKELVFDTWNELNPKIFMKSEKCVWKYEVNNPTFFK